MDRTRIKICTNCIYFHPEEYEEYFGGCGITPNHEKKSFYDDGCVDFTPFKVVT